MSPESTQGFASGNPADFTDKLSAAGTEAKARSADLARKAASTAEQARSRAAEGLGQAADAIESGAEEGAGKARRAARRAADALSSSADYLRENTAREIVDDAIGVVKNNPGFALLGAVAIGFVVGRAFSSRN